MTDQIISSLLAIGTAIIGLTVLAVLVSNQANTANVVASVAKGFAYDLNAATGPLGSGSGFGNGITSSFGTGY